MSVSLAMFYIQPRLLNLFTHHLRVNRLATFSEIYAYQGEGTCAADGMCQEKCPVKINTGSLIKSIRAEQMKDMKAASSGAMVCADSYSPHSRRGPSYSDSKGIHRVQLQACLCVYYTPVYFISSEAFLCLQTLANNFGTFTSIVPPFLNLVDFAHRLVGPKPLEFLSGTLNRGSNHIVPAWNEYMPKVPHHHTISTTLLFCPRSNPSYCCAQNYVNISPHLP